MARSEYDNKLFEAFLNWHETRDPKYKDEMQKWGDLSACEMLKTDQETWQKFNNSAFYEKKAKWFGKQDLGTRDIKNIFVQWIEKGQPK